LNNYEVNENLINLISDPLSTVTVYVPEFSQPEPPAIANVEYIPLFFIESCSAHTRLFSSFLIDKFTISRIFPTRTSSYS